MNQNNFLDTVGYFLDHRHWVEALKLLKFQLEAKKKNKHFNSLEMFYYEKLEASFEELESKEYFENKVANNLFYGLSKEFAVVPYTIPKPNLGLRKYKFMTCPLRILYYAVGLYLLELSQEYLRYHKSHNQIHAGSGGDLRLVKSKLNLEPNSIFYKKHYDKFRNRVRKENKGNTKRKVVIQLDIANYFDELSIPKLLDLLARRVKPSIQKKMRYDATTQTQLVSFFDFVMGGTSGIPQSDNNIISDFIGYLFLVFGDLFLDDELAKHNDSVDKYVIIRYVDDIYISITCKKQDSDLSDAQSTDLKKKVLNSLAPRISDCLYEKLGFRLNPKTRHFDLSDPCHKKKLEENLKKVSQGFDTADEENNEPPVAKLDEIFKELEQLKCSISPYFQEPPLNTEILKEIYDDNVRKMLEESANQTRLKEIFIGSVNFDFELVNADPSRIIILIRECADVLEAFKNFLLSKKALTSRDIYLILSYLCQTGFNQKQFHTLLKQSSQMKEIMEIFEAGIVPPELLNYGGLTEDQTLKIAQSDVIEQIRLRVLCELKGEHSVALNHLLNEIQAICRMLDENAKNPSEYKEPGVMQFLKNQQVPHETCAQIRNLFDRRNKSPVSHPDPIAWAVTKDEYMNYHSHVGNCLKHLGENCSLESS